MKKAKSLILLINTLSKSEKKAIFLQAEMIEGQKVYMDLFKLVNNKKIDQPNVLRDEYSRRHPKISFHSEVKYLYEFILGVLTKLKVGKDRSFEMHHKLMHAKILYERNLNTDYYSVIQNLTKDAESVNDYQLILVLKRMELDFLRINYFKDMTEKELLKKHHSLNEKITIIKQINEQSALYDLLLFRSGKTKGRKQEVVKESFNDLLISEVSLVSHLNKEVFEIQKLHQLFQAHYLSYQGDYKAALNSYIRLDELFRENQHLWDNPPFYYVSVLEGILKSLRANCLHDMMPYFFDKLKSLIYPSLPFQTTVSCILFIYQIDILLYKEEYERCLELIDEHQEVLIRKADILLPYRFIQLSLSLASIYLWNKKYVPAKKQLVHIIQNPIYMEFTLFRVVQLVNLIICYDLEEIDLISSQIRSIRRMNKMNKNNSRLERLLFYFMNQNLPYMTDSQKNALRVRIESEYDILKKQKEESFLYHAFDFKKWMLSHLK